MRKHTTIKLDMALVDEASIALETKAVSETVNAVKQPQPTAAVNDLPEGRSVW